MIPLESRTGKVCCRCKHFKEYLFFYKASKRYDGFQTMCKSCDSSVSIERHSNNPNKNIEAKIYRELPENKARSKAYHSDLYEKNIEVMRERNLKWARENKAAVNSLCAKRRANKKRATPKWTEDEFEQFFIEEIYNLGQLRKKATGIEFHVDHIVPITSEFVCGLHCMANLQLLSGVENLKKHNRFWPNMWN